jgi:hypothetical protein
MIVKATRQFLERFHEQRGKLKSQECLRAGQRNADFS